MLIHKKVTRHNNKDRPLTSLTSNGEVGGCVGELQASLLHGCRVQEQAFSLGVKVIPHQRNFTAVQVVYDLIRHACVCHCGRELGSRQEQCPFSL